MKKLGFICSLVFLVGGISACGGKSADFYYKEGNQYMKNASYEEALVSFQQAIQKNPERAEYYIAGGFALIGIERFEEALNEFDKGHSDKENQVVRENNKALYRGKGIALVRLGRYQDALENFKKGLAIKEYKALNSDIKKYMALTQIKLGNYTEAIKIYEEIMTEEKPTAESYYRLARAYRGISEFEKAIETYESAIKMDKTSFDAYFGEYEIYKELGKEEEAKETLERAAGIKVTDDIGGYHHGILEYLRGNYEKAIIDFEIAYDKKIFESSYYLGRISALKGDFDEARVFYERYQKDVGTIVMSGWYDGMAECEMEEGNYEKAMEFVNKGLTMEDVSFMKSLYVKKIAIEEKMNHYLAAYDTTEEYLKLYPNDERVKKENLFLKSRIQEKKER